MTTAVIEATPVMTVNAPSPATRANFLVGLKNKGIESARRAGGWAREMSDRSGASRAFSFIKKYAMKAYHFVTRVVGAAGVIPLSILAMTSRTGQHLIKGAAKWCWGMFTLGCNMVIKPIDWIVRRFGKPGNQLADWARDARANVTKFVNTNATKVGRLATPYLSPDRIYMRAAKAVSYVIVAAGLISTFVSGAWVIPAYLAAGGFGLLSVPEIRTSVLVNRLVGAFEDRTKTMARRTLSEAINGMMNDYGPDVSTWGPSEKADHALKQAIYNSLDGAEDPFKGLSGNQRKKAEKWLINFRTDLERIEKDGEVLAGNTELSVDSDGHITVKHIAPELTTV